MTFSQLHERVISHHGFTDASSFEKHFRVNGTYESVRLYKLDQNGLSISASSSIKASWPSKIASLEEFHRRFGDDLEELSSEDTFVKGELKYKVIRVGSVIQRLKMTNSFFCSEFNEIPNSPKCSCD